jgi:hypothetical protein
MVLFLMHVLLSLADQNGVSRMPLRVLATAFHGMPRSLTCYKANYVMIQKIGEDQKDPNRCLL